VLLLVPVMVSILGTTPHRSDRHQLQLVPASPPTRVSVDRIRVGVMLSEFTATGEHPGNEPFDIGHQSIIKQLISPNLDLFIITDAGPQTAFGPVIAKLVPRDHVIVATDLPALRKLDVVVADHVWLIHDPELRSIRAAVEGGVGFLQQAGFGVFVPSYTADVMTMQGFAGDPHFYENRVSVRCAVAADHELLRGLSSAAVVEVPHLCGTLGDLRGMTPLLVAPPQAANAAPPAWTDFIDRQTKLASATRPSDTTTTPQSFVALYVGQIGAGRIVGCQWHDDSPAQLRLIAGGDFYLRCIRWLAHRPIDQTEGAAR
jgi:hypothetical protein